MYWWIRAKVSGWTSDVGPSRCRERLELLPVDHPARASAEHEPELLVVEAGELRRPDRDEQRVRLAAVRVVGRVEHLLRRDLAVEVEQVEPAPDGRVEEDARDAAEPPGEPGHVGDPRVRDDELDALVAPDERLEVLGDRRKPAAAVDEDRHGPLDREREHGLQPLVAQRERLRARMELDAARAAGRGSGVASSSGCAVRSRRTNGTSFPPERSACASVRSFGHRERRLAVVLVEAEHERAAEPVAVEHRVSSS